MPGGESLDLFAEAPASRAGAGAPLAARMRPRGLGDVVGQAHLLGPGGPLRALAERGSLPSLVLWGPPGCGKTTLARIVARGVEAEFVSVSAVSSGVADLRRVVAEAQARRASGRRTVLFIDEIHRFNKAQQDVILPYVEDGTVTLIGATTENPSFEVIAPLLSRARVVRLKQLGPAELSGLVDRALADRERGLGSRELAIDDGGRTALAEGANGDGRAALTALEIAADVAEAAGRPTITAQDVAQALQDRRPYYDRQSDYHYDTISAFIKAMRGSDPDAALYWLAKMIHAGEDPRFIARRIVIHAAEDVGLADPMALVLANAAFQAAEFIGWPEARIPIAEATIYIATANKSNSVIKAIDAALEDVKSGRTLAVPEHLRDGHYKGAKQLGHGVGYKYAHDYEGHFVPQDFLGAEKSFYEPTDQGVEKKIKERVEKWRSMKSKTEVGK